MHIPFKNLAFVIALAGAMGCGSSGGGGGPGPDAGPTDVATADGDDTGAPPADGGALDAQGADAARTDAARADATGDRATADANGGCPVAPTPTGTSHAGGMCTADEACGGDPLACDTDFPGGFCTGECVNNRAQACEQAQCGGGGATCLSLGDGADAIAFCAPLCNPTARTGMPNSCRAGSVCTGWWYTHDNGAPDRTGCEYFCQSDAQCTDSHCNPRTGQCDDSGLVTSRRADGEPCDPTVVEGDPPDNVQCRGLCFTTSDTDEHQGLCGSLINLAITPDCPDLPTRILPASPSDDNGSTDNLALCIDKECMSNADCTAPLRCIAGDPGDPSYCGYPDGATPVDAGADVPSTDATAPADAARADVPAG